MKNLRFLLLQIRNPDDAMRAQEAECFIRALSCEANQLHVFDLLSSESASAAIRLSDLVLIGGSGEFSAAGAGEWLERALDVLRHLYALKKPTFASCWGFQAMARALGGQVVHDPDNAELGTHEVGLTEAGVNDPVFSELKPSFLAQMGHQDRVRLLPCGTVLLASTERVENQAYRFIDRPIYCTQFHPELDRVSLLQRVDAYPEYIQYATGLSLEQFAATCNETPEAGKLLKRFIQHVFGD